MTQTIRPAPAPVSLNGSGPAGGGGLRSQRRGRLVVGAAGLVVLALAVVVFEALVPRVAHSREVLVAARSIGAGEVIGAGDLRAVSVASAGFGGVAVSARDRVVGRTAAFDIAAGQPLVAADVGGSLGPGKGEAVVGVSLVSGRFPGGLAPGDSVVVVDTPAAAPSSGAGAGAAAGVGPSELGSGRVLSVARSSDGTRTEVGLVVPAGKADAVVSASALDAVSLVWVRR